jgi:hypothetical protein
MKKTLSRHKAQKLDSFLFTPDLSNQNLDEFVNYNNSSEFLYSSTNDSPNDYNYNNSSYLFIPSKENHIIHSSLQTNSSEFIEHDQISQSITDYIPNSATSNLNNILSPFTSLDSTFDSQISIDSNESNTSIKSKKKIKRKKFVDHYKIGSILGTPCCPHECLLHYSVSGIFIIFIFIL